jgi:hypothetical protein
LIVNSIFEVDDYYYYKTFIINGLRTISQKTWVSKPLNLQAAAVAKMERGPDSRESVCDGGLAHCSVSADSFKACHAMMPCLANTGFTSSTQPSSRVLKIGL